MDAAFAESGNSDGGLEKSVNFTTFVTVSTAASKATKQSSMKPGATMVPQVKGASMISQDPTISHLL